jgi:hypothetical protein
LGCAMPVVVCLAVMACRGTRATLSEKSNTVPQSSLAGEPPVQSGVYGFSGASAPMGDPEGVIGDCVWIFDEDNRSQIAKGVCEERDPGRFRVVLKPGRYVLRGPGGNKAIEVRRGGWVKIESVALLPVAP